jgi:hypothetical protein
MILEAPCVLLSPASGIFYSFAKTANQAKFCFPIYLTERPLIKATYRVVCPQCGHEASYETEGIAVSASIER